MKLKSLHIQNFRALADFEVKRLGRVNVIVGKNNSGKSTVLEALRIYAGNANHSLLAEIASGHNEKYYFGDQERGEEDGLLPFESFFTGRCFPIEDEKPIVIGEYGSSLESLRLQHIYLSKTEETINDPATGETRSTIRRQRILRSALSAAIDKNISQALLVSKNEISSLISLDEPSRARRFHGSLSEQESFPCSYIPTQFVSLDELADDWDKIALSDYAENVKIALNFIEDGFEDIAFVKDTWRDMDLPVSRRSLKRYAKIKMSKIKAPVPLNSMGDGMLRILQLAVKVFPAKGGFLLIDEFENGLHFGVQEKVWAWLFDLAEQLKIQVFATTHSWDCVESFTKVTLKRGRQEGTLFRVGHSVRTSDEGKVIATEFSEDKLASLTQADVEVR